MNRLLSAVIDHRWVLWGGLTLLTVAAIVGVCRLRFSDQPRLLLDRESQAMQRYQKLAEAFALDAATVVLVVEADELFSGQALAALRDLVDQVAQVEGVQRVHSLLDLHRFERPTALDDAPLLGWMASLVPRPLVPAADAAEETLAAARAAAIEHPLAAGLLLSADGRTTLINAELEVPEAGEPARRSVRQLQALAQRYRQQTVLRVRVTGVAPIRMEILTNLRREMPRFLAIAVGLALALAIVLFGQMLPAMIAGGAALLGVLWSLGALGLAGQPLDLVNNVLPTLVLVIGFTDAVHLMFEFRRRRGRGDSLRLAARRSVRRVGPACALTSLTTGIGFGSLGLARTEILRQFGLAAAAGTVLTFLAVVTLVPLACSSGLGGRIRSGPNASSAARWMQPFLAWLGRGAVHWRRTVSLTGLLLAAVLGSTALGLTPNNRMTDALPEGNEAQQALQHVDQHLGGILEAQVVVQWSEDLDPLAAPVLAAMRETHAAVIDQGVRPWSLVNLIDALPEEYRWMLSIVDATEFLSEQRADQLVQPSRRQGMIHIRLPDWGTAANAKLFDQLRDDLQTIERDHPGVSLRLTGLAVLASENVARVMQDLVRSIGLAAGLISLVMMFGFRSLRLGLISLLPNLFPLTVVAAVIYLGGGTVTLTALMVFSVCLGIATDDTIHFLNGLRHQRQPDRSAAVVGSMRRVGPALATSTLVLLAGFVAASFSSIPTTQAFARLASIAVATALVADLILLPALLAWLGPRRRRS